MFWNIETFGSVNNNYGNSLPRANFVAQAIVNSQADVVLVQEVCRGGQAALGMVQTALNNQPGQDWYLDWVAGSLSAAAVPPYSTHADTDFTFRGHYEGYALFWKQNIAKFVMQPADPIDRATVGMPPGAMVPNMQSISVSARGAVGGANVLAADIVVPAGAGAYSLPVGSTVGAGGILRGGAVAVAAGVTVAISLLNAADILPVGTIIGAGGMTLTALTNGVPPIVVPQDYTLTAAYTLPANPAVLVPQHAVCLVLTGRPWGGAGLDGFLNFNPLAPPPWALLNFPDAIGTMHEDARSTRRPATCTIRVSTGGVPAAELVPITVYHTPLNAPGMTGMVRGACCRSLYQAYDHAAGAYIINNLAVIGGDFNQRLNPAAGYFTMFTDDFPSFNGINGGAGCNTGGVPNIRVNEPWPPAVLPVYPPLPPVAARGPANVPANKSLGILREHIFGPRILSGNPDHYRNSAFDNGFYRGFTAAQAPQHAFGSLYFLPAAVSGAAAPAPNIYIPAGIITPFQTVPVFNIPPPPPPPGAPPPPPPPPAFAPAAMTNVLTPATLLQDIQAGGFGNAAAAPGAVPAPTGIANPAAPAFPYAGQPAAPPVVTPQRRAAEFIKLFVSDHLPVLFQMNL